MPTYNIEYVQNGEKKLATQQGEDLDDATARLKLRMPSIVMTDVVAASPKNQSQTQSRKSRHKGTRQRSNLSLYRVEYVQNGKKKLTTQKGADPDDVTARVKLRLPSVTSAKVVDVVHKKKDCSSGETPPLSQDSEKKKTGSALSPTNSKLERISRPEATPHSSQSDSHHQISRPTNACEYSVTLTIFALFGWGCLILGIIGMTLSIIEPTAFSILPAILFAWGLISVCIFNDYTQLARNKNNSTNQV